jgi:hypothetical protein
MSVEGMMSYFGMQSTAWTRSSSEGKFWAHDVPYNVWKMTLRTLEDSGSVITGPGGRPESREEKASGAARLRDWV